MIGSGSTQRPSTTIVSPEVRKSAKAIADEAVTRWRHGDPADARQVLLDHPEVAADHSLILNLALEEYCQRKARGDRLGPQTFREKFESFGARVAASVERQVQIEDFVDHRHAHREPLDWPNTGDCLDDFRIVEELGRGGIARVYLCEEESVGDRLVVVKLCPEGTSEQHWLGRLSHPNIVPVLSARSLPERGGAVVCMPFVGKHTLNDLINDGGRGHDPVDGSAYVKRVIGEEEQTKASVRSWRDLDSHQVILHLHQDIAAGLAHAHQTGIVHGDVKPTNVLATASGAMLIDFNLAFCCGIEQAFLGGTLPYLAPERVTAILRREASRAAGASPAIDSFSFAITLADSLLGRRQSGISTLEVVDCEQSSRLYDSQRAHVLAALQRLPVNSSLPAVLRACVHQDPSARPTAIELRDALASELSRIDSSRRRSRLTRRAAGAVLAAGIFGVSLRGAMVGPTPTQQYVRAKGLLADQRYEEASSTLSSILDRDTNHFAARYSRAWASIELGDFSAAYLDLRFLDRLGHDDWVAATLGYCQAAGSDYSTGAAYYKVVAGQAADNVTVLNNYGCCLWNGRTRDPFADQIESARSKLSRAAVATPTDTAPALNLVLLESGLLQDRSELADPNATRDAANRLTELTDRRDEELAAAYAYALLGTNREIDRTRAIELLKGLVLDGTGPDATLWERDFAFQELRKDEALDGLVRHSSGRIGLPRPQLMTHPRVHPLLG